MSKFRRLPALLPWLVASVALALATGSPLATSQPPSADSLGSTMGRLVIDGQPSPLPFTMTGLGVVVALEPIVERLGGELIVGPLQQSHKLELYGHEIILGPDSGVMTVGEKIVRLSRPPLAGSDGRLEVPIDFLDQTYGDQLGYRFDWRASSRELEVSRRSNRRLPVEIDRVQISATTTLVLQFPERPRYRWVEGDDSFEIIVPGDLLEVEGRLPGPDSLVRNIEVERDRVRVTMSANAQAAEPYLLTRGASTQLVIDISRRTTPLRTRGPGSPTPGSQPGSQRRSLSSTEFQGMKIVVDPGHGGGESGAVGSRGTLEKDLTMQLATTLKRRLEARLPVRVILTRDADTELDPATRTAIANQNRASLFISLHLNSEPSGSGAHGAETYFLDLVASDARAAASARFENQDANSEDSGSSAPGDLELMLWDLAQSRHLAESQRLAKLVQEELNQTLGLRNRGVKQAPFKVLGGATMPAILVELGFISNRNEEDQLLDPAYRIRLVDALVEAIGRYRATLQNDAEQASGEVATTMRDQPPVSRP